MTIRFIIYEALPVQNTFMRLHHSKRTAIRKRVAIMCRVGLNRAKFWPGSPVMQRCAIRIERVCRNAVDPDGLSTCAKHILDVLQPKSQRHPDGLGVIADDARTCIIDGPVVTQRRLSGPHEKAHMVVEIEELP